MSEAKMLVEAAIQDERWLIAAQLVVDWGWDMNTMVAEEVERLTLQVLDDQITVQQLRQGVAWANELDRESVHIYGSSVLEGDQAHERTARRVMHQAGRCALGELKTSRLYSIARATCKG